MESNSVTELLYNAKQRLKTAGITEYALDAELLIMRAAQMDRIHVLTDGDRLLDDEQKELFESFIERRIKREPIAYILGNREFMGMNFLVERGILIPRPDTEILVEKAIDNIKKQNIALNVAEVGTGTGCIAISIAKYTVAECYCTDINADAVRLAKKNAQLNGVSDRVHFYEGDIFKGLPENIDFNIIVSNPPYINKEDMEVLMDDVKYYEPHNALFGGNDGMDFYRSIAADGVRLLKNGGDIFLEIGYDEAEGISEILRLNGYENIEVIKDLSGLDRVIAAHRRI